MQTGTFLTAEWRYLAMVNYLIDPAVLLPYVPPGTELDSWHGLTFVSMVGFMFLRTRIRGVPVPFHRDFEEVNLRFYVRRRALEGWRRGVVFIKEIVPRRAVAAVARAFYNENYVSMPMGHRLEIDQGLPGKERIAEYSWNSGDRWSTLGVRPMGQPLPIVAGSQEEFIAEHYWGYASQTGGGAIEYQVEHAPWRAWNTCESLLDFEPASLYGPQFADSLTASPVSAFLAEGSPVIVRRGTSL